MQRFSKRWFRALALTAGVVGLVAGAELAAIPSASAAPVTLFPLNTTPGTYTSAAVPADICFVTVSAAGGAGGFSTIFLATGGLGASVVARVAVTPGTVFGVLVAGQGATVPLAAPNNGHGGDGGFGGGGGGGGGNSTNIGGAGGGGASAVSAAGQPLVVAGGGGGASGGTPGTGGNAGTPGNDAPNGAGVRGGDGGHANGNGGTTAVNGPGDSAGGGGGVGTGGSGSATSGSGGTGNGAAGGGGGQANNSGGTGGNVPGTGLGATVTLGGDGGTGAAPGGNGGDNNGQTNGGGGGGGAVGIGGGGGGYSSGLPNGGGGGGGYGGGSGGGASNAVGPPAAGFGGGGGSSFLAAAATPISAVADHIGNGAVTITYDPATDACPSAQLLINKRVRGDEPDGADYNIRYSCVTGAQPPVVKHVVVHGEGPAVDETFSGSQLPVTCTVTEPDNGDADKVKFSCSSTGSAVCETNNRITFPSGATSAGTITVTNIFDDDPDDPAVTPAATPIVSVAPTFTG